MVDRKLSAVEVEQRASTLDFPQSVVEFFEGLMGQPFGGFPEPLRTDVLRGRQGTVKGRPGLIMEPVDFDRVRWHLLSKFPGCPVTEYDLASYIMYPEVYMDFRKMRCEFGDLTALPTRDFLIPPVMGQEIRLEVEGYREIIAEMVAIRPADPITGQKDVLFRLNGGICQIGRAHV